MKRLAFIAVIVGFFAALPAYGDTDVSLTGVGGASQGGVYVAPYYLSINGGASVEAICNDYTHEVYVGETWKATIETFSSLAGARFGSGLFQQYSEAAWLFTQFLANPSKAGDINFAIWALFSPTQTQGNTSGWTAGAQSAFAAAQLWFSQNCSGSTDTCKGIDLANFEIITPTDLSATGPQEYIVMTPEPGSIVLLGMGVLFLGFAWRKLLLGEAAGLAH
jgi:hypothetical protein